MRCAVSLLTSFIMLSVLACGLAAAPGDVIFNEIMYRPQEQNYADEYIELHNRGAEDVDLSNWRFNAGVRFEFPAGTVIRAGGYLVVTGDVEYLAPRLGLDPEAGEIVGNWTGHLQNSGERVRLVDASGETVESFIYSDRPPFPTAPDGEGPSLERISPTADNDDPANWAASARAGGWRRVTLRAAAETTRLRLFLTSRGRVLIDTVSVTAVGDDRNLVSNPDFEEDVAEARAALAHQPLRDAWHT